MEKRMPPLQAYLIAAALLSEAYQELSAQNQAKVIGYLAKDSVGRFCDKLEQRIQEIFEPTRFYKRT